MRHPQSDLLRNEVSRNPWLWGALVLCTLLLAVPPYSTPMADVLQLTAPSSEMWAVILVFSAAPLMVIQLVTVAVMSLRQKPDHRPKGHVDQRQ